MLAMAPDLPDRLFNHGSRQRLSAAFEIDWDQPVVSDLTALPGEWLAGVEVLLTGWGAAEIDAGLLSRMPDLRSIHHAAGSVRRLVGDSCWDRGIRVTTAAEANAIPVGEYAAAMIVLAAKQIFRSQVLYRARRAFIPREKEFPHAGNFGTVIGLVGASRIGRHVIELLRSHQLDVLVYDPFLGEEEAEAFGVEVVSLEDLFTRSAVVSLHAPLMPATAGMVTAELLGRMQDGATLINTARGGLVDADALESELVSGRLWAVLDATDPNEPLPPDSALYELPNVVVTPHMAGAVGNELQRLGDHAVEQALRAHRGEPLAGEVTRETVGELA
ncbi:MAG: hydroxyacid dehydrogenase [Nocardioides sp.]|uniref:hydroxyacid dehydrogenase n=1 Tax=Nocardioides sp. TaxID=35761 RepID=UPI0039E69BF7